jgi:hypothetical protein
MTKCDHEWKLAGTLYAVRVYRCKCGAMKIEIVLEGGAA